MPLTLTSKVAPKDMQVDPPVQVKGKDGKLKPLPNKRVWRVYICTFTKKPTPAVLKEKRKSFTAKMQEALIKLPKGKFFKATTGPWLPVRPNSLSYIVKVFVRQTNRPPGPGIPTPMPPPKAPGSL